MFNLGVIYLPNKPVLSCVYLNHQLAATSVINYAANYSE